MVNSTEPKRSRTLWEYCKKGFVEAHHRRPFSFYLLLLVPIVLLLGAHIFDGRTSLYQFTMVVGLLFLFFWIISAMAVNDFIELYKKHWKEGRQLFLSTIGDPEFTALLGARVNTKKYYF